MAGKTLWRFILTATLSQNSLITIVDRHEGAYVIPSIPPVITGIRIDLGPYVGQNIRINSIRFVTMRSHWIMPELALYEFDLNKWPLWFFQDIEQGSVQGDLQLSSGQPILQINPNINLGKLFADQPKFQLMTYYGTYFLFLVFLAGILFCVILGLSRVRYPALSDLRRIAIRVAINTSVVAVASLLCLLVMEVLLQVISPPSSQGGIGTVSAEKAKIYGWAYPPGITMMSHNADTGEVTAIFKSNSEGWKDVEHTRLKPEGIVRVLIIGDSHTFGVPALDRLYTRRLETILHERGFSNVEVITIALAGWSTGQALLALETEGIEYQPDFVIYQFCENDYDGNVNYDTSHLDQAYAKPFIYKLSDGKLIKEDKTKEFLAYVNRKNSEWSALKLLNKSALYQRYVLAIDRLHIWNEKPTDVARGLPKHPLKPDFGNVENRVRREFNDKDWDVYKKNYKAGRLEKILLARKIIERQTNKKLGVILPAYDPFVYEAGELSDLETYAWELMSALLARFKEVSGNVGAKFLVFSEDGEEGKLDFYRQVGNVETHDGRHFARTGKDLVEINWQRGVAELRKIGDRHDFPVIPQSRVYHRYLIDNHANEEGNENMALDIADFLESWPPFVDKFEKSKG